MNSRPSRTKKPSARNPSGKERGKVSPDFSGPEISQIQFLSEDAPVLIAFIGLDEIVRFTNATPFKFWKLSAEKIAGKSLSQALKEALYQAIKSPFKAALKGKTVTFEVAGTNKGKEDSSLQGTFIPKHLSDGTLCGVTLVALDTTERTRSEIALRKIIEGDRETESRLREREAHLRGIMDNAADGVITTDKSGNIMSFSHAAEQIFGFSSLEAIGKNVSILMPEPDKSQHDDYLKKYIKTGKAKILGIGPREVTGCRKDGTKFPMDLATSEMLIGDNLIFIGVVRDISERKKAEEELRAAIEQTEVANRSRTQFLANIGHELRTPLNAIIGFSDMIISEIYGPLSTPEYKDYINSIHESAALLLEIINEVLDISKTEAGKVELREVNIHVPEMIDSCLQIVRERIKSAELSLDLKIEKNLPMVFGDERLTKQILINLLSNAIKFTPSRGTIQVRAELNKKREVCLRVIDNGIGMAPEELPKALSPFGQLDGDLNRKFEGTGLGLTLTKAFVELHQGKLIIDTALDKGTTVTVCFPASRSIKA